MYVCERSCALLYTLIFMGVVFGEVKYLFEAGRQEMYYFHGRVKLGSSD